MKRERREAQTRFDLIDPALKAVGWGENSSRIRVEFPISKGRLIGQGRREKPLSADYMLQYRNRNLAIIEVKDRNCYYTEGVTQAKDYAKRLHVRYAYSTNGDRIYQIDMETGTEAEIDRYPTPEELWTMTFPEPLDPDEKERTLWRERFFAVPFEDRSGSWQPRYYQENAITRTLEAIADGKKRILLTLATGTGKTAIAFQKLLYD